MQFKLIRLVPIFFVLLLPATVQVTAQPKSATRRVTYAEARKLLAGAPEGNLVNQPGQFTRTRLGDGRVLEIFYPLRAPSRQRGRAAVAPGYGLIYQSEAALTASSQPHHMLEDLIPDGRVFIEQIAPLVARLEKRIGARLNYSPASMRRLDGVVAGFHSSHTTAQTDPRLFQELTAYYGEALRRAVAGEWRGRAERVDASHQQIEPNISFATDGRPRELKPWSSVIKALYDEDNRGAKLSKLFAADLAAAQRAN